MDIKLNDPKIRKAKMELFLSLEEAKRYEN